MKLSQAPPRPFPYSIDQPHKICPDCHRGFAPKVEGGCNRDGHVCLPSNEARPFDYKPCGEWQRPCVRVEIEQVRIDGKKVNREVDVHYLGDEEFTKINRAYRNNEYRTATDNEDKRYRLNGTKEPYVHPVHGAWLYDLNQ